jgi:hypothetical protein
MRNGNFSMSCVGMMNYTMQEQTHLFLPSVDDNMLSIATALIENSSL